METITKNYKLGTENKKIRQKSYNIELEYGNYKKKTQKWQASN